MTASPLDAPGMLDGIFPEGCSTRVFMDRVLSKWGNLVIAALSTRTMRWGELRHALSGVSEKMLAQTLRTLEAEGLINRISYPEVPPRVEYSLTDRGRQLADVLLPLLTWIQHDTAGA